MRIIISPAKKMNVDRDSFPVEALPQFLDEAERLRDALRALPDEALQRLWRCNDALAALNTARLRQMDLRRGLTPALLSYEGIQYRYLAPGVLEAAALDYLRERLRILSGFYGLLRPFDGVTPYRLEMQARLGVDGGRDLYAFWGGKLAAALAAETDCVVDLASQEYSRAVAPHLPPAVRRVACVFAEEKGGKLVEKGTLCKMARGQMVRWMAQHQIEAPEDLRAFADLDYRYTPAASTPDRLVFLR